MKLLRLRLFVGLLCVFIAGASTALAAPTTLSRGELAIVSYETDLTAGAASPDALRFVVLKEIGSGTVIFFSDRNWNGSTFPAAGGGDGTFTYTAGSDVPAGTVITITGAQLGAGGVVLSNAWETIYAYQGAVNAPATFLFAIDVADGNTSFDGSLANTGLTNGSNAVAVPHDNASFAGTSTEIPQTQIIKISTSAQWHGSDQDDNPGTIFYTEVTDTTVTGPLVNPDMQIIAVMAGGGQSDAILRVDNDEGSNVGTNLTRLFRDNPAFNHLSDIGFDMESGFYFVVDSDGNSINRILRGNIADLVSGTSTPSLTQIFATDGFGEIIPNLEVDTVNKKVYWLDGDLFGTFEDGWEFRRMNYDGTGNEVIGVLDIENPDPVFGFAGGVGDFALDVPRDTAYIVSSTSSVDGLGNAAIGQNHIVKVNSLVIDPDDNDFTVLGVGTDTTPGYVPGRLSPSEGQIIGIDVDQRNGDIYFVTQPQSSSAACGIFKYVVGTDTLTKLWERPSNDAHNTLQSFPTSNMSHIEFDEIANRYYVNTFSDTDTENDATPLTNESDASLYIGNPAGGAPTRFVRVYEVTANGAPLGMEIDYAPTLTVSSSGTYTEQPGFPSATGAPVPVISSATAADPDGTILFGATVAITGGFVPSIDTLSFTNSGGITGSYAAATGVITFTGSASLAAYQTVLASVRYTASGDNPTVYGTNQTRTLSWTVFDGLINSNPVTSTVTVIGANDAPQNGLPSAQSVNEDTNLSITGLSVTDPDADPASHVLTTTLSVSNGTLTVLSAGGATVGGSGTATVTLTGTSSQINTTLGAPNNVVYRGVLNYFGGDSLTVTTNDGGNTGTGGALQDVDVVNITVHPVNDEPTLDAIPNPAAIDEDAGQQTINLSGISAGPANESSQTLTVTAVSNNTSLIPHPTVTYTSPATTGSVSYTPVANAHGTAIITVRVQDDGGTANGGDDTIERTFTVVVNPVADTPSITNATTLPDTQTTSGLVVSRNPADGAEVTHFQITNIQNGSVFLNDGVTPVSAGSFITFAPADAGLKFTPAPGFQGNATFDIQASTSAAAGGLGGDVVTATIAVNEEVSIATLNPGDDSAEEGGVNNGVFTFTRGGSSGPLVANFQLDASSTATAADFTLSGGGVTFDPGTGAGTVTFPGGQTSVQVTLSAIAETPDAAEPAETVRFNIVPVALPAPGAYLAGTPDNATVTIAQNGFVVTNTNDAGEGSLRQAVLNANAIAGTDTITFSDGAGGTVDFTDDTPEFIDLESQLPTIVSQINITGPGAGKLTLRRPAAAATDFRLLEVSTSAGHLDISGLTITGGRAGEGGGISCMNGGLTMTHCVIHGNTATGSGGGGIYFVAATSRLRVAGCTISGNTATSGSGGGMIVFMGSLGSATSYSTLINTTISGNSVGSSIGNGGGLYNVNGQAYLINCTITGNQATPDRGGGVATFADSSTITSFANTLVAGNANSDVQHVMSASNVNSNVSLGGNLIGFGNSVDNFPGQTTTAAAGTILDTTLANNGGPTQTHALVAGSPALNAGTTANAIDPVDHLIGNGNDVPLTTDQRGPGFERAIGVVDIGAFELQRAVSILADDASKAEGTGAGTTPFTFTVSRSGSTDGPVTVDYAVTGSGAAPANAADFGGTLPSGQVTIADGSAAAPPLIINVSQDAQAELDEGFTVTLSNPTNDYALSGAAASSTIINDDALTVTINQAAGQADPTNASPVNFTVVFSEPVTGFVTGDVTLTGAAGATTGTVAEVAPNNGTTYNVAVTGMTGPGTVIATIPAARALSAGNADNQASTSTDNTVTYDATAPDTSIDTFPPNPAASNGATFSFSGSDVGTGVARFETSLDGGSFTTNTSPQSFTGLSEGSHTFEVRAVDNAGNVDPSPASYTWVVDTIAPDTTITGNPPALSNSANASFTFTGNDGAGSGVAGFEVQIDGGAFIAAASPQTYIGLSEGSHTFQVRAIDAAGNTDGTPASYTWVIDTTPPAAPVVITPANGSFTNDSTPAVTGTAEPDSTVTVFIDGTAAGATTADGAGDWTFTTPAALSEAAHTVRARATDAAGNTSVDSNTNTFTVDTIPPDTVITNSPFNPTNSTTAHFSFTDNGTGGALFEASLDGSPYAPANTGSVSYFGLSEGSHTFQVRSTDAAGNVNPTPATHTWTVDTTPPTAVISSTAPDPLVNGVPFSVTITFSEPVYGFGSLLSADDLSITNGTSSDLTSGGDGSTVFTFDLTPTAPGQVSVFLKSGSVRDAAQNFNSGNSPTYTRFPVDEVSITATDAIAAETGGNTGTYTFTRLNAGAALVVDFQLDASSTASASDYTLSGGSVSFDPGTGVGTVTIPAGQTSVALTLTAVPEADIAGGQAAEPAETIRLNVLPRDADYAVGALASATVTITENGFVVINTNDSGDGSLRQAVLNANSLAGDDTITFAGPVFEDAATPDVITLTSGQLGITSSLTIKGLGTRVLHLSGNDASRVIFISAGNVTLEGLTIRNGSVTDEDGAGIYCASSGGLTIKTCAIRNNLLTDTGATADRGAGVFREAGTLTIEESTVSGNQAVAGQGAGIALNSTIATLTNCTLSGNSALQGGGLYIRDSTATLVHATVTGNSATADGGGLFLSSSGTVVLANTLVAENTAVSEPDISAGAPMASLSSNGGNLVGNNSGTSLTAGAPNAGNDWVGTNASPIDPMLGPLADNDGPTDTHMLLNGSPAINAGLAAHAAGITHDQRGEPNLRTRGPAPDSGAVEAFAFEPTISAASTDEDTVTSSGLVISANTADGGLTTHYQITAIRGGMLFHNDGSTVIGENDFITLAEGAAGLKFLPDADLHDANTPAGFGFTVQAAVSADVVDLRGDPVVTDITVNPVADLPSVTGATTIVNEQTTDGLVLTVNPVDGSEVTHFRISNISNGSLFQNDGVTPITDGGFITIAQGGSGLKFTPALNYVGPAGFDVQAATDASGAGLSGIASVEITVNHPVPEIEVLSPPVLNPRTGLFEHIVRVSNTSTVPMAGFRLTVVNLPPELELWNRTHPVLPVIEDFNELPPTSHRDVLVAYYSRIRQQPAWTPEYRIENLSSLPPELSGDVSGVYHGWIGRDDEAYLSPTPLLGSRLTLKVTARGAVSGSLLEGKTRRAFKGRLAVGPDDLVRPLLRVAIPRSTLTLRVTLDSGSNTLIGFLEAAGGSGPGARATGWRNVWRKKAPANLPSDFLARHHFMLENLDTATGDQGFGFGHVRPLGKAGRCTVVTRLADGSAFTGSTFFGPNGQVLVYKSLYKHQGSALGTIDLMLTGSNPPFDNTVCGEMSWLRPATSSAPGFGPVELAIEGGVYTPPAPGQLVMGLLPSSPGIANAGLDFSLGALASASAEFSQGIAVTNPRATGKTNRAQVVAPNANGVVITSFNAATGAFAGRITVPGNPARKGTFRGQIVPTVPYGTLGFGYYLLPDGGGRVELLPAP